MGKAGDSEKKPVERAVVITMTLAEAATALGHKGWAATNEYLDADSFDDVYHGGHSAKDIASISEPDGLEGAARIFPGEVASALEDLEREGIAAEIGRARRRAIKEAFEAIEPIGEYQSADGEMISVRGCGVSECEIDVPNDKVTVRIRNPEHVVNDLVAGVGMFYPGLDPYEAATDAEIKSGFLSAAGGFFDVYGARKPSDDIDDRFQPDVKDEDFASAIRERISSLELEEVAAAVLDAVDSGRVGEDALAEAVKDASRLAQVPEREVAKAALALAFKSYAGLAARLKPLAGEP